MSEFYVVSIENEDGDNVWVLGPFTTAGTAHAFKTEFVEAAGWDSAYVVVDLVDGPEDMGFLAWKAEEVAARVERVAEQRRGS